MMYDSRGLAGLAALHSDSENVPTPRAVGTAPWFRQRSSSPRREGKGFNERMVEGINEDEWESTPAWARVRTPSPDTSYYAWRGCPPPPPCLQMTPTLAPRHCTADRLLSLPAPICDGRTGLRSRNGTDENTAEGADSGATSDEDTAWLLPSIGSVYHPHGCAQPCKYFAKAKGCKDGMNCTRCHLCVWVREGKSRKKPRGKHTDEVAELRLSCA